MMGTNDNTQDLVPWPKTIKLADVVNVVDDHEKRIVALEAYVKRNDARITALEAKYDAVVTERGTRIAVLEQEIAAHQAGAIERQTEIDQLRGQVERQAWYARTGRRP